MSWPRLPAARPDRLVTYGADYGSRKRSGVSGAGEGRGAPPRQYAACWAPASRKRRRGDFADVTESGRVSFMRVGRAGDLNQAARLGRTLFGGRKSRSRFAAAGLDFKR